MSVGVYMRHWTVSSLVHADIPWKRENLYDTNFVVIGDSGGCHDDNPRYHQWRQGWYYNNSRFSVIHCVVKDE